MYTCKDVGKVLIWSSLHLLIWWYVWFTSDSHSGNISLVITLLCSSGPGDEMEVDTKGCFSAPRDGTSGRVHERLFGCVWWTQQPNKLSPGSTGPCERFMCLNVKSCSQRWQVGAFSRVPCRFRQIVSARLTNRSMFFTALSCYVWPDFFFSFTFHIASIHLASFSRIEKEWQKNI